MKRILCGLLAGVMALSLTACGQSANTAANETDSTTNTTETAGQSAEETKEAAEATANTEPIELTMYFPVSVGGGPDALIDALCAQYHEENPNVTVKPVYAGSYADTRTKVQAAINLYQALGGASF